MKKLTTIILILIAFQGFAQVETPKTNPEVYSEYDISDPFRIVRLEIGLDSSHVRIFYWKYRYIAGIRIGKIRFTDCYVNWNINHTYAYTYQLFNAWIREKYNIE